MLKGSFGPFGINGVNGGDTLYIKIQHVLCYTILYDTILYDTMLYYAVQYSCVIVWNSNYYYYCCCCFAFMTIEVCLSLLFNTSSKH